MWPSTQLSKTQLFTNISNLMKDDHRYMIAFVYQTTFWLPKKLTYIIKRSSASSKTAD